MCDTEYCSVAERKNQRIFTHRAMAHEHGMFQAWELRRKGLKPTGKPCAVLVDAVEATEFEREIVRDWNLPSNIWLDEYTIAANQRNLYSINKTKPYRPTAHTKAVWRFQDIFVREWKRYEVRLSTGSFLAVDSNSYRDGLNEGKVGRHVRGKDAFRVFAGRYSNFILAHVASDQAEALLEQAEHVREQISASKWFCQISAEGLDVFWVFPLQVKTESAVKWLERLLTVPATIGPTAETSAPLPLSSGRITIADRPVENVVELVEWLDAEDGENMATADILAAMHGMVGIASMDLLYIAYQIPETTSSVPSSGEWKNRTWRLLTGFFTGQHQDILLNTILVITARHLHAEGLPREEAEKLLTQWCREIPSPKSSRLQPGKERVLAKDIRTAVSTAYNDNGRQNNPAASTEKLEAVIAVWRSKGLILSDRSTWELTYGHASVPEFDLTGQERQNVEAYLMPLLSTRDTKGRNPVDVAVLVVKSVVRLVAAKERDGKELSVEYLQKYIHGEAGVSTGNRNKTIRLIKALHDLGFVKTLKQGFKGQGATRYGLAGRLAEVVGDGERTGTVVLPDGDLDQTVEEIVVPFDVQEVEGSHYGSIIYCVSNPGSERESQPVTHAMRLTDDPVFNELLLKHCGQKKPVEQDRRVGVGEV